MLLCFAVLAASASAQSLPDTGALPSGGAGATLGPDGLKLGVESGPTGGVTVGAGPGGVDVQLGGGTSSQPSPGGGNPSGSDPAPRTSSPSPAPAAPAPASTPAARDGGNDGAGRSGPERAGARGRGEAAAAGGGDGRSEAAVLGEARQARAEGDDRGGVAPVFDLVERIPTAVRAGLIALALIAIALWLMWVRGRRRLEQNAYVDPVTGVANMAAFEQTLDRECQRAARYRRPLGLLLLEVEQRSSGGLRVLPDPDARHAVNDIQEEVRDADMVARLSPSRFAVICPEAPHGAAETLARAIEHRLEERRLRSWTGVAERAEDDSGPADLVSRAARTLADSHAEPVPEPAPQAGPVSAAA